MDSTQNPKQTNRRWAIVLAAVLVAGALAGTWLWRRGNPFPRLGSRLSTTASMPMTMPMPMQGPLSPPPESTQEIEISIPAELLARIRLEFAKVTESAVGAQIRVPGRVQPNAYKEVRVTPLVGGVVKQVSVELGQTVKRGQALAQVFSRELAEAQSTYVAFKAQLEAEHKKLLRTQELVRLGAASRQELETVEADHQVHVAHLEEARQRLLLLGLDEARIGGVRAGKPASTTLDIPAPIDGAVLSRSVNLGQVVTQGQELFLIADLSSVWIEGDLLEDNFNVVNMGSRAAITTPAYPNRTYRGAVEYIDPRVDAQTRTTKVRVAVENPGLALRLGMYMDMSFTSPVGVRAPVVPKAAMQRIGSTSVVYLPVEKEPGRFVERIVTTAEETAQGLRVLEGLKPGERVVTEGSVLLRAEALRQHPR